MNKIFTLSSCEAKERLRTLRKTCKVGDVVTPVEEKWGAAK